jgi:glucokinase
MATHSLIVLDVGGTKINIGHYQQDRITQNTIHHFDTSQDEGAILAFIIDCIEKLNVELFTGIAIGVPGIVDIEKGVIFDAVNIAAWQEVGLKSSLENYFKVPVYINNDVNCFVVGESLTEIGETAANMIGLCLGTGFGAGMVINNQLYAGQNCSAGELGCINYLDGTLDDYCSGQFFKKHFHECGNELAIRARQGDQNAIEAFNEFGRHLANAINYILLVMDPTYIVIGGSVANSYELFIESTWQHLNEFPYKRVLDNLTIAKSEQVNSALLGAAHLFIRFIEDK